MILPGLCRGLAQELNPSYHSEEDDFVRYSPLQYLETMEPPVSQQVVSQQVVHSLASAANVLRRSCVFMEVLNDLLMGVLRD